MFRVLLATLLVALGSAQSMGDGSLGSSPLADGPLAVGSLGDANWGDAAAGLPAGAWVQWLADDLNGNDDGNSGRVDGAAVATWTSSGSFSPDLVGCAAGTPTLIADCGGGTPCVRSPATSCHQVTSGAPTDWDPLGTDGGAFSCHFLLRTSSTNPNALYVVYATSTTNSGTKGSLLFYDDRAGSGREDTILWRHYAAGELVNSPSDMLDNGNWRVISVDYPGPSAGDVVLSKDGVSFATVAASAYANQPSTSRFNLGAAAASTRFAGDFRAAICWVGAGSQGLALAVTTALQARFP